MSKLLPKAHEFASPANFERLLKPIPKIEEKPSPQKIKECGYTLQRDLVVRLGAEGNRSKHLYRLIEALDTKDQPTKILTNLMNLEIEKVCLLRIYRWTVEIVIRWLKRQLKLDHFFSNSPRGVILQVLMALIVYGLLVLYHQGCGHLSLVSIRRQLNNDLHQALIDWGYEKGLRDALKYANSCLPAYLHGLNEGNVKK